VDVLFYFQMLISQIPNECIHLEHKKKFVHSLRSGLNRRPSDYKTDALPLSYTGKRVLKHINATGCEITGILNVKISKNWTSCMFRRQRKEVLCMYA
jgi:hypothetical protein